MAKTAGTGADVMRTADPGKAGGGQNDQKRQHQHPGEAAVVQRVEPDLAGIGGHGIDHRIEHPLGVQPGHPVAQGAQGGIGAQKHQTAADPGQRHPKLGHVKPVPKGDVGKDIASRGRGSCGMQKPAGCQVRKKADQDDQTGQQGWGRPQAGGLDHAAGAGNRRAPGQGSP